MRGTNKVLTLICENMTDLLVQPAWAVVTVGDLPRRYVRNVKGVQK